MATACLHAASASPASRIELADVFRRAWQGVRSDTSPRPYAVEGDAGNRDVSDRCPRRTVRSRVHSVVTRAIATIAAATGTVPSASRWRRPSGWRDRQQELLPTPYFHNVFTLPHELNGLVLYSERNRPCAVGAACSRRPVRRSSTFGRNNLGGKLGFTLVLHTWDQQLRAHFHVHALVAGGVLAEDGSKWNDVGDKFLFPVRALSKVFRGKYVEGVANFLQQGQLDVPPQLASPGGEHRLLRTLRRKAWVVYSKRPFAGPSKVLDYLGRYTHRVAISNHRLLSLENGQVEFAYRDRRDGDRPKTTALPAEEFIRRFLKHVLPDGFMRIRHYGLLGNRTKKEHLTNAANYLPPAPEPIEPKTLVDWILLWTGEDVTRCPQCGHAPLWPKRFPAQWLIWPPA